MTIRTKRVTNCIFLFIGVNVLFAKPENIQKYIMIDQFGYRPGDIKYAVIVNPRLGFNAEDEFIAGKVYEVRRWDNDEVVFSGSPEQWNQGATDFSSGDKGWWFNFTGVKEEGEFYIYDKEQNEGSYKFSISPDVYKGVMKEVVRTFYYQRLNASKEKPWAKEPWLDPSAFTGPGQDSEATYLYDKNNPATSKDLSGGWMDAGDYNKYVTFASSAVHMMLTAYQQNPGIFTDDYNIPESGNGIPDIIDEVKYELEWIKKMQQNDGGVIIKLGNIDYDVACPPSADKRPRYYGPECSSSSIATAGMFAHASHVFEGFPELKVYANDLKDRAVKAWNWYKEHDRSDTCDSQEIKSGDADVSIEDQDSEETVAAIYMFAITGEKKYNDVVKDKFYITAPFFDTYRYLYFSHIGDALLYYTTLSGADKDTGDKILTQRRNQGKGLDIYRDDEKLDLYMAYIPTTVYNWGSNNPRTALGSANYDFITYNLHDGDKSRFLKRASGILHYLHGVNPFGIVYLSNMYREGGDYCADEIFHSWFGDGSEWDGNPPPGYLTGGPNFWYNGNRKDLPVQPPQKCYLNTNSSYPENSWELTEPGIYYQASYIKLLSKFIGNPGSD